MAKGSWTALGTAFLVAFFAASASVAQTPSSRGALPGAVAWLAGDGIDASKLQSDFEALLAQLRAFGPRTEGGPGEAAAAKWIASLLEAGGLSPSMDPLDNLVDDQSDASAVSVRIPGRNDNLLVFIAPLDQHRDGPEGEGDAAIALMLAELRRIASLPAAGRLPPISMQVVFLPGDKRGSINEGLSQGPGPAWWLAGLDAANPTAVVYLSIDSSRGPIALRNAERGVLSPWWLYDRAVSALGVSGLAFVVHPNRMQGYRLGLLSGRGPLAPYLDGGIPAIELRGGTAGPDSPGDAPAFSRFVEALVEGNAQGFLDTWDRNYSSFRFGSLALEIREGPYMVFLLFFSAGIAILVLTISLRRRALIPRFLEKLPHRLLNLGLLGLLSVVAVLLSFACLGLESLVLGAVSSWKAAPGLFAVMRVLVSVFAFLGILSLAVSRHWISPDPWFYEIAALVLFGLDIFLFAFLSLPLSLYFCWAFIVVLVSTLVRRKIASVFAVLLMMVPIGLVAWEMFATPESSALAFVIAPDPGKGLLLSLVILPYATMFSSPLLFFAPRGIRKRRAAARFFIALAIVAELVPIAVVAARMKTMPLSLSESFDQSTSTWKARVESDTRLSALALSRNGAPEPLRSETASALLRGVDSARPISLDVKVRDFLDRSNSSLSLDFPRAPDSISLSILSDKPLAIYDCSLPYRVDLDGHGARVFVGPGKGKRLTFTLTTDAALAARLIVDADFAGGLSDWKLAGSRPLGVVNGRVEASFALGGPPR
ncbi:MAG TPA: hypothetical protein VMV44_02965 [Rectinemataceae bacterium]|nr:hypothetical protein [Rectinemataceae bacterium]